MATAGGLVIAGIGAVSGYQVTDLVDRYIATYSPTASPAPTLPAGVSLSIQQYNQQIVAAKPGLWRVVGGLVSMAFGFAGGAVAPWAGLKMFLYGWGLGATTHLSGQLLNGYVLEPLMMSNGQLTASGSRLFANEAVANAAVAPAAATTTTPTTSTTAPATGAATAPTGTPTQATSSNAAAGSGTQTTGTTAGLGAPPGLHSARGTPMAALGPARAPFSAGARVPPIALAARRGAGLGASNDFTPVTPAQPPGAGFTPPQTVYPPPAPTPPVQTQTVYPPPAPSPAPTPAPAQPAQNCAPCSPQPGPPQGSTPCRGGCGGSCGGQCGEPPPADERNYMHPIFQSMLRTRPRRAA